MFFVDGTQIGTTQNIGSNSIFDSSTNLYVGCDAGSSSYVDGWMDEVRVTKGYARWTSNFTAPSAEYSSTVSGTAMVISNAYSEPVAPTEAMVIADETLNGGTITYYVSRDNGTTWTTCTKETMTNISSQPSGTQLKWKVTMTGNAELNAIAVAV
jgi:Neuraminidase (sialidase)